MLNVKGALCFMMVFMLVFSILGCPSRVFASAEADALSAIVAAENEVVDCYKAVADAEKAGANVTGLLSSLDEAGWVLSKANLALSMGDFDSAVDFALRSQEKLVGLVVEADALEKVAVQQCYWDFMVNVLGSIVGTVVVVCGGFAVWFFLKRKYVETGRVS